MIRAEKKICRFFVKPKNIHLYGEREGSKAFLDFIFLKILPHFPLDSPVNDKLNNNV